MEVTIMYIFSILLFLAIAVQNSLCDTKSKDWDILIFTQHWPITVCIEWKEKEQRHTCVIPKNKIWTVHGIWPSKLKHMGPQFCNNSLPFDHTQVENIEGQLEQYWINVYNNTLYGLWKHEWKKHGTCAAVLPALNTVNKYFSQGLKWIMTYNMDDILSRAGINPGLKGYSAQQVWDAVYGFMEKRPTIHCVKDNKTADWFLSEIRVCFNKSFDLIDCDGIEEEHSLSASLKTNCPLDKPFLYLPKSHREIFPDYEQPMQYHAPWLLTILRVIQWLQWITL